MFGRVRSTVVWGCYWVAYAMSHLSAVLPSREGVWVFGADGGDRFADNPKYLFLHAARERDDVRAIWLSENDETIDELRAAGYEAYRSDGVRGVVHTLLAEYVFVCLGRGDVAWWATGGTHVVNLWHGCPLKRIGADRAGEKPGLVDRLIFATRDSAFNDLVTTADGLRRHFASAFDLSTEQVPALGYPRNDVLRADPVDAELCVDVATHDRIAARAGDGPVVAYMPTYRRGFGMAHGGGDGPPIDEAALHDLLDAHDATFLVKHHPHATERIGAGAGDRIIDLPDDYDIYPSLDDVDVLLTDYSSVYLDYLHLDRPVVFYPYDREAYEARPGFYFDYDAVTPGPTPETFGGLYDALDDALAGVDEYEAERSTVRNQFFDHPDADAAALVADYYAAR